MMLISEADTGRVERHGGSIRAIGETAISKYDI